MHNHMRMYVASIATNIAKAIGENLQDGCITTFLMEIGLVTRLVGNG